MKYLFAAFFAFFLCTEKLCATHIVGGEITYKCLGNQKYEISLTVYRDCYNGIPSFDNPANVAIYDAQWALYDTLRLFYNSQINDTLPVTLVNPCLTVPPNVCVHGTVYKRVVTLPFKPGGYTIVYQRCCRNKLIRNLPDPLNTGISFIAEISEKTLLECNSSATFDNWPPVAICVNEPIDFDHGASDPDGDSLAYRLCTPLSGPDSLNSLPVPPYPGPYPELAWNDPPYNLMNVLGGDPLTIDPYTGFLTGVPNMIGNYVVGVCVDEFRDGELISTTRRDFQYNVADCGQPYAAFFAPEVLCDTLTIKFQNLSSSATFFRWYFDWGGDLTKTSVAFSPVYTFPDTGSYVVALIAEPGDPCSDTLFQTIQVSQTLVDAALQFVFPDCDENGLIVQATDLSSDPVFGLAGWQWTVNGPGGFTSVSNDQNPQFVVNEPGDYQLQLVTTSGNGCRDSAVFSFFAPIPPTQFWQDSLLICPGDTIQLNPDGDPEYLYAWSPALNITDITAADPLVYPQQTTLYSVTISGNGPCVVEKQVSVEVFDLASFSAFAEPDTVFKGDASQLSVSFADADEYIWEPSLWLSDPASPFPLATPDSTITYQVTARLNNGCEARSPVTVFVIVPFCEEPYVFFPTAFSPNGDGQNDILKLESIFSELETSWVIYNRWGERIFEADSIDDFWDGSWKGKQQPVETYGYFLRVGCPNGQVLQKQGNVTLLR